MKKIFKWIGITVGALITLLIIGAVALPFVFPLDKIKDLAAKQISTQINREIKIEKVSFNIFEGISLEKLTVGNRSGFAKKSFITADAIVLRYAFWPLFQRQIIIKEARLENPSILIEKNRSGVYNFSDLVQPKKAKPLKKEEKDLPFSMIVDTFSIRGGHITYTDYTTGTKSELKNANLTLSGVTLALLKPIGLDFSATAVYKGKNVPISVAGKIGLDLKKDIINIPSLSLGAAGERATLSAKISNLKKGPNINFSLTSNKFLVDPFLAVFSAGATQMKAKPKPGVLTKTISTATRGIPRSLTLNGNINIANLGFQSIRVDKVKLGASLSKRVLSLNIQEIRAFEGSLSGKAKINLNTYGLSYNVNNLKLSNLNAAPFSNAMVETFLTKLSNYKDLTNKVYGTLNASVSLSGRGVEVADIMKNANASGSFTLKNGEIKRLKTIDAIASKINAASLKQDLKISKLSSGFSFKNQVLTLKNLHLINGDLKVGFDGGLSLSSLQYIKGNRLRLKGSPAITKNLSREYNLLRDDQGWLEVDFELKGSLKKPIPMPIFEKAVDKLKKKVEEKINTELKKAEEDAKKKLEAEKKRLAEEAKKKLEEEAKNKLKNLIKF